MRHACRSLCAATMFAIAGTASAAEIEVMTQNQYLGADIAPLIEAIGTPQFNDVLVDALRTIASSRSPERFIALAALITKRQPHVVGLQEVWEFRCLPAVPELGGYPCNDPSIAGAFNDHLQGTMAALGSRYDDLAYVQNFTVESYFDACFCVYLGIQSICHLV